LTTTQEAPKIGRPCKLTPELIAKFSNYIAHGNYAITACRCCGLGEKTFYDYVKLGEADIDNGVESIYAQFIKSLKSAEAECEASLASMIKDTALDKKEWLPAMTFLERRHPERWGRKDRLNVDQQQTVNVNVIVKHYQDELPTGVTPQIIDGEAKLLDITPTADNPKTEAKNEPDVT